MGKLEDYERAGDMARANDLRNIEFLQGVMVWMDETTPLPPGDPYAESIEHALRWLADLENSL